MDIVKPRWEDILLVLACSDGNLEDVKRLIEESDADICYQDHNTGMSVLMAAAGSGHVEIVKYLLSEGAPWNAVDRKYLCAGDYAARKGHQDCIDALMNYAVMAELLLSVSKNNNDDICVFDSLDYKTNVRHNWNEKTPGILNASYLSNRLEYTPNSNSLIDTKTNLAVMMDWESPLMAAHAAWICFSDYRPVESSKDIPLRVLNIGFGMGIIDREIQKYQPSSHVIIEAHPEVLDRMNLEQWHFKPNVRIIPTRWQDAVNQLCMEIEEGKISRFDGIFFDTYAEEDSDLKEFHSWLPKLLREPNGDSKKLSPSRYSYYNGVCPDNVFFHGVACETIRLCLKRLGLECIFDPIAINASDNDLWKHVSERYWYFDTYFVPKCTYNTNAPKPLNKD